MNKAYLKSLGRYMAFNSALCLVLHLITPWNPMAYLMNVVFSIVLHKAFIWPKENGRKR